jgi:hypothetical protein
MSRDPRHIAIEAASRGMMTAAEVWDAACRWKDLGEPADPVTVLDGIVDPDRAASLVPTRGTCPPPPACPTPWSPPPPT